MSVPQYPLESRRRLVDNRAMSQVLTDAEVARFGRDGFVHPIDVLPEAEALAFRRRLEDAEARFGPMHYVMKPHLLLTLADELVHHPRVVGAVADLLGPDVLMWDSAFIIKEPRTDKFVSWHQDLTYWGLEPDEVVSVWLALSPATAENGCMRMMPGSHARGMVDHRETLGPDNVLSRGQTIAQPIDESQAVVASLRPGQMSLHHGWTFHASYPNRSDERRIGFNMNLMTPRVRQTKVSNDTAMLLCGEDRIGHFAPEPRPAHDFAPEACAIQAEVCRRRGDTIVPNAADTMINAASRRS